MSKLGFIGLGIMGAPMAAHLIEAGHEVFLNTRSKLPSNLLTGTAGNFSVDDVEVFTVTL